MADRLKKKKGAPDLDLLPVMNLFSILIPFLLSVAVFQKLAIVEVHLPERSDQPLDMNTPPPPDDQALALTVAITDEGLTIWARGGALPTVFAKEMWTYRCKSDNDTITYDPAEIRAGKAPVCRNGQDASQYEIETVHLWSLRRTSEEDPGTILTSVYNANDSAFVDGNGEFLTSKSQIKVGAKVATLREASARVIDAKRFNDSKVKPRSAYDELAKSLIQIHNRFIDAPDAEEIIVLANDNVFFDKVINVMDVAREAGFWKIQLAKLEGG